MPQHINNKKVLLVVDAYKKGGSPALVTRHLIYLLRTAGAIVGIYSDDIERHKVSKSEGITEFPRPTNNIRVLNHLLRMRDVKTFASVITDFRPDIVHFVPISYRQSGFLIDVAKSAGVHMVGQLWGPSFYCSSHYSLLGDQVCSKCASGNFFHAIINHCFSVKGLPIKVLSLLSLKRFFRSIDVFLSTSKFMDARLIEYGIKPKRIIRFPLPFSPNRCEGIKADASDHVIYYGQAIQAKGVHLLPELVKRLPNQKFEFYFSGINSRKKDGMVLKKLTKFPNVTIRNDIGWENGVAERVASALAVLIPSLWPTTTETVLMESLGLGKPIVAFDVGVHSDILRHYQNALVYPPGDIQGFTEGVKELINQAELRKLLSEGAGRLFERLTEPNNLMQALKMAYGQ